MSAHDARRSRPPAARAGRRLGGRPARPDGAALSRRRLVNPDFFGSADAFQALLRDTARYGVMAVGMTFVIVNKDLDLSVGSTYGLIGVVFSHAFSRRPSTTWARSRRSSSASSLGTVDRPDQRRARHLPARAGLHRDADDAAHRPRLRARPDRRQVDPLSGQGARVSAGSSSSARPTPRLQQPDPDRARRRRHRRLSCSPRPAGATRPSPPAATSRPRSMPASRRTGCASAPICCRRSAPRSPA